MPQKTQVNAGDDDIAIIHRSIIQNQHDSTHESIAKKQHLGKPTDGLVSRYINRRLSAPISRFIVSKFGDVSPNKVTIAVSLFGIASALIYLLNAPIIAGIAVQIASIIDGIDGEIARMLNKQSKFGALLDSIMDRIVDVLVLTCFSIYTLKELCTKYRIDMLMFIMFMALSGSILVSYFRARCESSMGVDPRAIGGMPIATRDVRLFIIFIGSILGLYLETLIIIAVLSYLHVFINIGIILRIADM